MQALFLFFIRLPHRCRKQLQRKLWWGPARMADTFYTAVHWSQIIAVSATKTHCEEQKVFLAPAVLIEEVLSGISIPTTQLHNSLKIGLKTFFGQKTLFQRNGF